MGVRTRESGVGMGFNGKSFGHVLSPAMLTKYELRAVRAETSRKASRSALTAKWRLSLRCSGRDWELCVDYVRGKLSIPVLIRSVGRSGLDVAQVTQNAVFPMTEARVRTLRASALNNVTLTGTPRPAQ